MKRFAGVFILIVAILLIACGSSKPAYKTSKGKKKLKYYNALQYNNPNLPPPPNPPKKKKKKR